MHGSSGARPGARIAAPRLVGFFGDPGPSSETLSATLDAYPNLEIVTDPERVAIAAEVAGKGALLASRSDGSVLVLSGQWHDDRSLDSVFETWLATGERALEDVYFHGLLVGWNAGSQRLAIVRDRYGVETGYYAEVAGGLLFADEQRPLILAGVDATADPVAIDIFLATGYFPAPLTPYRAVRKLAPGSALVATGSDQALARWADHDLGPAIPYDDAVHMTAGVLRTAVERIWPSDGEVGLLLSGGIDSAMVLATITEMLGRKVTAFTFKYEDYEGALNEGDAARVVASYLGVDHEEIRIHPGELIDDLDDAVAAYGEPLNWGLHSYRLDPIYGSGIKAVFSGVGADGTGITRRHQAALRFYNLPAPVKTIVRSAVQLARPLRLGGQAKAEWVTRSTDGVGDLFSPDSPRDRHTRARLYNDRSLAATGARRLAEIYDGVARELDPADPRMALILMDKVFTSAEAMMAWNRAWPRAHGLTACLPFLDPDLIDLGLRAEGTTAGKDLIRRVAEDLLPNEVAHAPKVAQEMPVNHWLRGPIADPAREILSELPSGMADIFDQREVLQLVDDHVAGNTDAAWRIVSLLTLATWFHQNERPT